MTNDSIANVQGKKVMAGPPVHSRSIREHLAKLDNGAQVSRGGSFMSAKIVRR
jgi:hypothetical protein